MDIINLKGSEDTPNIILDKSNGLFEISGRSMPEDSAEFYSPIIEWLKTYSEIPNETTNFVFKLEYFNTSSSKLILDILTILEVINNTTIHWHFQQEDEDMEGAGEEFSELVDLPFEFEGY